jgi:uncharacterized membrane protein YkvA (DUF1232 family)
VNFSQLNAVLDATEMSPESLAPIFSVASMTVRRWQKEPENKKVPEVHRWNIIESVYKLVLDGKLSTNSRVVRVILKDSTPDSFRAITKGLGVADGVLNSAGDQQDKMVLMLSQIGLDESHKKEVEAGSKRLSYFKKMGSEWQKRISQLVRVIRSPKLSSLDKMVAYGALFYLITPFDLIPDHIPVIGLIDDFGILGFAVAYYLKRFPEIS